MTIKMNEIAAEQASETERSDDERDRWLIARFVAGDQTAFDDIVVAHEKTMTCLVFRLLGWSSDVEDVVQEVFVAVLANLHRFDGRAKFSTWLTRIAVNKCRSFQRWQLLRLRNLTRLAEQRRADNARNETSFSETNESVRQAVRSLRAKFREPIVLRYFEELSIAEIADILGLSTGAVQVRLSRARQQLKEKLSKTEESR